MRACVRACVHAYRLVDGPSALWDLSFHSFHPTDLSAVQRPPSPLDSLEREFVRALSSLFHPSCHRVIDVD